MNIDDYKKILKEKLTEKRYQHSCFVADEAKRLALKYGADPDKMYLAGLLHDITKNTDNNEQLKLFENGGIMLTVHEKAVPGIWHAMSGFVYLRDVLKISDPDILSAVRYHTTGKADMSLCEKIIFVADLTSKERDYPDVQTVRELAEEDLDKAILYILKFTLKKLVNLGQPLHPDTVGAYNYLLMNTKEN